MRLIYPLLWSRPGNEASHQQAVSTAAALSQIGLDVTLLMPRGAGDPAIGPDALCAQYGVEGSFGVLQRPSRWAGTGLATSLMWLRQVFADPAVAAADVLYSRIPAMLGVGAMSPRPFAIEHYRRWPDDWPLVRPVMRRNVAAPHCLGLVLHSDYAARSYRRLPVAEEKILVAHNGAQPAPASPRLTKAEARARLGLPNERPIAVYAGRINGEKGLDQLLLVADRRPGILFLLVGAEGESPLRSAAAARPNVELIDWQRPDSLGDYLACADVLVVPPSLAPLTRFKHCILPMKLFFYLAAGRPILAPRAEDTAEILSDGHNALLVAPERPDEAAAALDRLLREPDLAERLGRNAERDSAEFSWERRARRIATFLERRLGAIGRGSWRSDPANAAV